MLNWPQSLSPRSGNLDHIRQHRRCGGQRSGPFPDEQHLPNRPPANDQRIVLVAYGGERMALRQFAALDAELDSARHPTRAGYMPDDAAPRARLFDFLPLNVIDAMHFDSPTG